MCDSYSKTAVTHNPVAGTFKELPRIFCTNLQQHTLAKYHELQGLITQHKYDMLLLTETWYTEHNEGNFVYPGLNKTTTNSQETRIGGGVAVCTNSEFHFKTLHTHASTSVSSLWTLIRIRTIRDPIICGVLYHPPNLRKYQKDSTIDHMYDTVQRLTNKHESAKLLLYGHFDDLDSSSLAPALGLSQIIYFPNRGGAHLDKCFTNIPEYLKVPCQLAPPDGKVSSNWLSL